MLAITYCMYEYNLHCLTAVNTQQCIWGWKILSEKYTTYFCLSDIIKGLHCQVAIGNHLAFILLLLF